MESLEGKRWWMVAQLLLVDKEITWKIAKNVRAMTKQCQLL
jgi:hypothetical protein